MGGSHAPSFQGVYLVKQTLGQRQDEIRDPSTGCLLSVAHRGVPVIWVVVAPSWTVALNGVPARRHEVRDASNRRSTHTHIANGENRC